MTNNVEYKEIMAFHPGYYIQETIEELEITQEEFAIRLGTTAKTISKLVNGEINLMILHINCQICLVQVSSCG